MYEKTSDKKPIFTQTSLFTLEEETKEEEESKSTWLEESLEACNPLQMTPIEALNFIYELKEKMNGKSS